MKRSHPPPSRLPSLPHAVAAPSPSLGVIDKTSRMAILRVVGARGAGYRSRDVPFSAAAGSVKSLDFSAGGRRPPPLPPRLPAAKVNTSAHPCGCPDAIFIMCNHHASPSEEYPSPDTENLHLWRCQCGTYIDETRTSRAHLPKTRILLSVLAVDLQTGKDYDHCS